MEFKVGDKVKILDRVGDATNYSQPYIDDMLKYAGTIASIKYIADNGNLLLDNCYYWDKKAVKLVNEDKYLHPSQLKDGDFIKIGNTCSEYIYIFKKYEDNNIYRYASLDLENYRLSTGPLVHWDCSDVDTKITYATEEEKKLLLDKLAEKNYIWDDFSKMLIEIPKIYNRNPYKTEYIKVSADLTSPQELNLFPTKKHYQLNFNY